VVEERERRSTPRADPLQLGVDMRALRADLILGIIVVVAAAIYLVMDSQLRSARIGDPLGPKAFPALVGGGLILSAILLFIETWKKRRALEDTRVKPRTAEEKHVFLLLVGMVIWTGVYYFFFERLGYLIATPLFIIGLLSYFNRRRYVTNLSVAIGFTAVVYLLFSILLGVPLPTGPFDI
jgi:putative tricarboxylic transport membrane protein